jgi:nitrite reductase/ring-hydroxylating ferredoxin subunit/DMSO/TMAO reductase YedYZ heme-binding membrane subunit
MPVRDHVDRLGTYRHSSFWKTIMSLTYHGIQWNRQKKVYDRIILFTSLAYLGLFIGISFALVPNISIETAIIRASGTWAMILLHVILMIGPLARINSNFLPLLYNRRHLGVSMFLFALIHGLFSMIQFHALGNINPVASIFLSNVNYGSLLDFPFQTLGFLALCILFVMAATSHDFWLKNLSPRIWKRIHMSVYFAYTLIIFHILLGILQEERTPLYYGLVILGFISVSTLHLIAGWRNRVNMKMKQELEDSGYVNVCALEEIHDNHAKVVRTKELEIAVFKYDGKLSAVRNQCKHQLGPLGEGKIIDGCITCPWHGYQYLPHNGQSPPPFKEKVNTFRVQCKDGQVYVHPEPLPEGTEIAPAVC